ncbi:MAG: UDP-N-acetylmuramoyl-tripeptide--D-alanyl-D-alanine ligase [Oscillospiraceae bacterium]
MESLKLSEILKVTKGFLNNFDCTKDDILINEIITETREDFKKGNTIFIAIKGENFDGHTFLQSALENGAKYCISSNEEYKNHKNIITVKDTVQALIDISGAVRDKINAPFVGITGSVGKTTTKEMTACFLSAKYNVLKTMGNFNNQIGMPKTIFSFNYTDEKALKHNCGVIEMGTSDIGEIDQLTLAVKPNIAIITCIGVSHIENFKTQDNILKGKMEIVNGLCDNGTLILNYDDFYLKKVIDGEYIQKIMAKNILTYSLKNEAADVFAKNIKNQLFSQSFDICFKNTVYKATIPSLGEHNILNALAAFCAGYCLNVNLKDGIKALSKYIPSGARQSTEEFENGIIIKDYYNASPDSMKASLNVLASLKSYDLKVAVLSDMLELGEISKKSHEEIGKETEALKIDYLLAYGDLSKNYLTPLCKTKGEYFQTKEELIKRLKELFKNKTAVLIKGSRGMKLEDIYEGLTLKN